jgi:hypothetical protein
MPYRQLNNACMRITRCHLARWRRANGSVHGLTLSNSFVIYFSYVSNSVHWMSFQELWTITVIMNRFEEPGFFRHGLSWTCQKVEEKALVQVLSPYASSFIATTRIVPYCSWFFNPNVLRNPCVSEMMFISVMFECTMILMVSHLLEGSSGQDTRLSSGVLREFISWFDKPRRASKTVKWEAKWWKYVDQSDCLVGEGEMRCTRVGSEQLPERLPGPESIMPCNFICIEPVEFYHLMRGM